MAEKVNFKFRIIAQKRVYLCMDYREIGADTRALEVIRERDSERYKDPILPWVLFKCGVIIEPIVARPNVYSALVTAAESLDNLRGLEELARDEELRARE